MKSEKKAGIWLDRKQAFIVIFGAEFHKTESIYSEIEDFHPLGGSRSKVPYGPMEKISEKKYLERRKHQELKYFEQIEKVIYGSERVYLFGPAEMKYKLRDKLLDQYHFKNSKIEIENAGKMTNPQKIAQAKSFFGL